jgi:AmiR/NasT family two-component response regulator
MPRWPSRRSTPRRILADVETTAVHLRQAVESRAVIGQATGILMARRGLTADEAFEVLSRTSQDRNIKLDRLAAVLTEAPEIADQI